MPDGLQHPEPTLQATALRYVASDLAPTEAAAFEARLAEDQEARDAVSEAVRLSAAVLRQPPPTPHRSFRAAIRERLVGWCPGWLARRAYRGHPLAWAGLGAVVVAACTVVGLSLADREALSGSPDAGISAHAAVTVAPAPHPSEAEPLAVAPAPREVESFVAHASSAAVCGGDCDGRSVAEIWADLSTPDHVEKAHDEEMRWRQHAQPAHLAPSVAHGPHP